ncbi:MAG: dTDP-4-dehydrorhamnose 3,5-epimerase [Gammaproteobacteria bacterium]
MKITPTTLPDVMLIEPDVFGDPRGFFLETYHAEKYRQLGIDDVFLQDNQSRSTRGVLRGLHYQLNKPQAKLVTVVTGTVFDVAVDIRKGSPTFGHWVGCELSGTNHRQLYIPAGFAHAFCVLSATADFFYKCSELYSPESEHGILWNDPAIGIDWPLTEVQISDKDAANKPLSEMEKLLPVYRSDP